LKRFEADYVEVKSKQLRAERRRRFYLSKAVGGEKLKQVTLTTKQLRMGYV